MRSGLRWRTIARHASGARRGPVGWTGLALVGAGGVGLAVYYNIEKEKRQSQATTKQTTYGKPDLGGKWTLVSANSGLPVTDASYLGKYTLLYFGFSRCPDICPAELVKVGEVLSLLDAKKNPPEVQALFVSLDPNRDSIEQLRYYASDFDDRIDFLIGTPDQVKIAGKNYRVYSSVAAGDEDTDDYLIDHSIVLYLNGPDGDFLDFFTQSTSARDVAGGIMKHHANRK
ncbi:hypothetical protein CTAYLR_007932 [Chrysophaeum taylorii]|uniref:Uncharacterized protein n=1 Tax=Chrysophaeum taylorii TaxID=2483200 RepID=A0AAD7UAT0_9STRA|nr:hypothetical protein CTAYLR_007932 [Chrysophaeum taylorii]